MAIDISSLLVAGGTKAQSMKPSSGSPDSDGVWEIWWKITRWQKLSSNQVGSTFPHRILSNPHGCSLKRQNRLYFPLDSSLKVPWFSKNSFLYPRIVFSLNPVTQAASSAAAVDLMFILFCSVSISMTASIFWLCKGRLTTQSSKMTCAFSESKSETSSPLELPEAPLLFSLSLWTVPLSSLEGSLGSGSGRTGAEDPDRIGSLEELPCPVVGEDSLALFISHIRAALSRCLFLVFQVEAALLSAMIAFFARSVDKLDTSPSCAFNF